MSIFQPGEWVEFICQDGVEFEGILEDFTDDYVIVNGRGFPCEDIAVMTHG